jgi:glucokinase
MADACVIGVDLGGTKLLAGTVDAQLRVHHRAYRLSRPEAVVETIVEAVEEARQATRAEVRAVGIGVPCLIEPASGTVMACNHFDLLDVPLRDLLTERIGLPVVVDNDANAALFAEWRFGAARGARNVLILTIGTGVGGGMLIDGRILRGSSGTSSSTRAARGAPATARATGAWSRSCPARHSRSRAGHGPRRSRTRGSAARWPAGARSRGRS